MARGPLRPGARVGAFVVREEIGRGATSVVYEAEHRSLRHPVAVKVLRSATEMEGELRLRFEREMRLCSMLSSPHVPHVFDVGELPSGLPYIVMERLEGATLADWLALHRRLPVAVVVEIGIQLSAALAALHHQHVVHRDVKPENLLLHRAPEGGYVLKLVDLGICKPLRDPGPALTRTGTVVGTPEYMSPEQVQGIEIDARTDVYSTGIVLYELLAGRTPFEGSDLDAIGRAILFASPPRLTAVRNEVSAVLEGIVMRAMARDRSNRPPSIGALARELERFADEHALRRHPHVWDLLPSERTSHTPPPPPASPQREASHTLVLPRLPMRRAGIFGSAFVALAVLLGAIASVGYFVYEPFLAESSAEEPPEPAAPTEPEPPPPAPPRPAHDLDLRPVLERTPEAEASEATPAQTEAPTPERRHRRRRHRRHAAREREPARTTVVFAPTTEPHASEEPNVARVQVPPVTPPSVSAADLYAQVETAPHVSESPSAAPPPVRARPVAPPSVSGADIYAQVETAPERTRSVVGTLEAPRDRRAVGAPSVRASEDVPRSPYERALPTNPFD